MKPKALGTVAVAAVLVAMLAAPVGAHVEFQPESAPRGSLTVLELVVPNESATASTVTVELEFPSTPPIVAVTVQPLPGWQTVVERRAATSGGQSVDAVGRVTWTGGGLGPGQFERFAIRVGLPDKGRKLTFKALQTYSDGEVSRWIETAAPGAPEPEYPAPVLKLTRARAHD